MELLFTIVQPLLSFSFKKSEKKEAFLSDASRSCDMKGTIYDTG